MLLSLSPPSARAPEGRRDADRAACEGPHAHPTPTHRSPTSRMLLRYRWQSCSTWGAGRSGEQAEDPEPCGRGPGTRRTAGGAGRAGQSFIAKGAPGLGSTRWPEQGPGPPQGQQAAATHVGVPVSKDLVEDVAELPAEDGAAGKRQTDGIGPESKGPFLVMSAQNDAYHSQGQAQEADSSAGQVGGARGDPETHPTAAARPPASLHVRPRSPRAMVFSRGQDQGQGHAP